MTKHDEWWRRDRRRVIPGISEFVTAPKLEIFLDADTFMGLSTRKRPAKCKTMKMGEGRRTRSRTQGMRPVSLLRCSPRCLQLFSRATIISVCSAMNLHPRPIIAGLVMDDAAFKTILSARYGPSRSAKSQFFLAATDSVFRAIKTRVRITLQLQWYCRR